MRRPPPSDLAEAAAELMGAARARYSPTACIWTGISREECEARARRMEDVAAWLRSVANA